MPPSMDSSYIALGNSVWRRQWTQNQTIKAAIPTNIPPTKPSTTPPTIAPVGDFEDEEGAEVGGCVIVPGDPPYMTEAVGVLVDEGEEVRDCVIAPLYPPDAREAVCVLDEEGAEVGECAIVQLDPPDVREEVGGGTAIAIACALIAVDSLASKRYTVRSWLVHRNKHTSSKLSEGYIETVRCLLRIEHKGFRA